MLRVPSPWRAETAAGLTFPYGRHLHRVYLPQCQLFYFILFIIIYFFFESRRPKELSTMARMFCDVSLKCEEFQERSGSGLNELRI